jgi:hypothetical protein
MACRGRGPGEAARKAKYTVRGAASDSATLDWRPSDGIPQERVDLLEELRPPCLELGEVGRVLQDDELRAPRDGQVLEAALRKP